VTADLRDAPAGDELAEARMAPPAPRARDQRRLVVVTQLTILIVALLAWEFIPRLSALQDITKLFDPFFVSSPSRVYERLVDLTTGRNGTTTIWSYVRPTIQAALLGTALGMLLGAATGLILSGSVFWSRVLQPYIVVANAIPRVALIPIVVLFLGPTLGATMVLATMVVFFVTFYNAYEGGNQVAPHVVENAILLGATKRDLLRRIRLPYVLAWTLAVLPLAVTFSLLTVVTTEILTGYPGMGSFIVTASSTADSSLTFSIVVILAVLGVTIVMLSNWVKRRVLHWWGK
jgi:NitT/TauT family transport system permease protein